MPNVRELLERESETVDLERGHFERLIRRRDRKRRNLQIRAGALALVVSLLAIAGLVRAIQLKHQPADRIKPSPTTERVNFAGLPPEGTHPSTPAIGTLVLSLRETGAPSGEVDLSVYADGRMIWQKWDNSAEAVVVPKGANRLDTGFVEQRLTPQGVALLRSRILSTGLFDHNRELAPRRHSSRDLQIFVLNGGRLVSVETLSLQSLPKETPAQARTLARLKAVLADPAAWLPPNAWADRKIRAFVPSRYWVAFDRGAPDLSKLPSPARELLLQYKRLFHHGCQVVTTGEARATFQAFVESGIAPLDNLAYGLGFDLPGVPARSYLHFHQALPDETTC